jgi:hypothetical protein
MTTHNHRYEYCLETADSVLFRNTHALDNRAAIEIAKEAAAKLDARLAWVRIPFVATIYQDRNPRR